MYTRRDRKKGVLVNTPTHTWVYTRTRRDLKKGEEERCKSNDIGSFSNAVYLNKK
jgi:hypothetical protein